MTIQELLTWCEQNNVSLDTHIALRAKDDYFLTEEGLSLDHGYFGNSYEGMEWERKNTVILDEEENFIQVPKVLILDSFSE